MAKGKYRLLTNTAYIDYAGDDEVEIGKIVDNDTEKDVMYIFYKKNLFKESGYHLTIYVYENEEGEYPVAMTDDLHRSCMFLHPEIFLTLMLHELGHFLNGDFNATETFATTDDVKNDRLRCVLEGRVQEQERKADAFALACVGRNTFMRTIDYLIHQRQKRKDDGMAIAIREFELRKKAAAKK